MAAAATAIGTRESRFAPSISHLRERQQWPELFVPSGDRSAVKLACPPPPKSTLRADSLPFVCDASLKMTPPLAPPPPTFTGAVLIAMDCEMSGTVMNNIQTPVHVHDSSDPTTGNQLLSVGCLVCMQTSEDPDDPNQFIALDMFYVSLNYGSRTPAEWKSHFAAMGWTGWSFWSHGGNLEVLNSLFDRKLAARHAGVLVDSSAQMATTIHETIKKWRDTKKIHTFLNSDGSVSFYARSTQAASVFDTSSQDQLWINRLLQTHGYQPLFTTETYNYAGAFAVIDSTAMFFGALGIGPLTDKRRREDHKNRVRKDPTFFMTSEYGLRPLERLAGEMKHTHHPLWDAFSVAGYYAYAQRHAAIFNYDEQQNTAAEAAESTHN